MKELAALRQPCPGWPQDGNSLRFADFCLPRIDELPDLLLLSVPFGQVLLVQPLVNLELLSGHFLVTEPSISLAQAVVGVD